MAADRDTILLIGRRGLNLRDSPLALHPEELTKALNFRITSRGTLEKRLGEAVWSTIDLAADVIELATYTRAGQATQVVAYCADGVLYTSPDGATWTAAISGLASDVQPSIVQFLDKLYVANGVDHVQQWDGAVATSIASSPIASFLTVWRNRLFVAGDTGQPRRVLWSKAGDPTDWTNKATNFIDFPDGGPLTAIATVRISSADATSAGGDGVLVFSERQTHRIYDDSDNVAGVITGGANVLIDAGMGCVSSRSVASVHGRLYVLGTDGVYSTDGHSPLRLESDALHPIFHGGYSAADAPSFCAVGFDGNYLLSYTPLGAANPTRLLECYLAGQANEQGQRPWMAHDIASAALAVYPATGGDQLLSADADPDDTARIRRLFNGGSDTDNASDPADISAVATSGGLDLGLAGKKAIRKIIAYGYGVFTVTVQGEGGRGEGGQYAINVADDLWNPSDGWTGTWGEGNLNSDSSDMAYYTRRGRFIVLEVAERSQAVGPFRRPLDTGATEVSGGMAITALQATITPLDSL